MGDQLHRSSRRRLTNAATPVRALAVAVLAATGWPLAAQEEPVERFHALSICVIDYESPSGLRLVDVIVHDATGDTMVLVDDELTPLGQVFPPLPPPQVGPPSLPRVGPPEVMEPGDLVLIATHGGQPVFVGTREIARVAFPIFTADRPPELHQLERDQDVREAFSSFDLLYIPIDLHSCLFQPVEPFLPEPPPALIGPPPPAPPPPPLPTFPERPPRSTDRIVFSLSQLGINPARDSVGGVAGLLQDALKEQEYDKTAYFAVPQGFALVTRIERIDDTGAPAADRWGAEPPRFEFSLRNLLDALFNEAVGRYRLFVFLLTDRSIRESGESLSEHEAEVWLISGGDRLPSEIAALPLTPEHALTVLVYEFEKRASGQEAEFLQTGLFIRDHLRGAGLWAALAGDTP